MNVIIQQLQEIKNSCYEELDDSFEIGFKKGLDIAIKIIERNIQKSGYAILCFERKTLVHDLDEILKTGFKFKTILSEKNDILEILLFKSN